MSIYDHKRKANILEQHANDYICREALSALCRIIDKPKLDPNNRPHIFLGGIRIRNMQGISYSADATIQPIDVLGKYEVVDEEPITTVTVTRHVKKV